MFFKTMNSRLFLSLFLIFSFLSTIKNVHSYQPDNLKVFSVKNYGAIADGQTDNSQTFLRAWTDACQNARGSVILIPKGIYLLSSTIFKGSCKGRMYFILQGKLLAPLYNPSWGDLDHWISFQYLENFFVTGGGSFDGQGASAWSYNSCTKNPNCKQLPVALRFDFVRHSRIHHINLFNSKNFHINIFACNNLELDHIHIIAPGDSPNTDGIHIGETSGIRIHDSIISTGDDCISMGSGVSDVEIRRVHCGPGHGISIGSLGRYVDEKDVRHILVKNCTLIGTQNGVRIKTWSPSKPSNVFNLTFERIIMVNVNNPIIIDQNYCPSNMCSHQGSSEVQIRNVKFREITGTSSSKVAVSLNCSSKKPCQEIELNNIGLSYRASLATSECSYANGVAYGYQKPPSCL